MSHRALILGAMATGVTDVEGLLEKIPELVERAGIPRTAKKCCSGFKRPSSSTYSASPLGSLTASNVSHCRCL